MTFKQLFIETNDTPMLRLSGSLTAFFICAPFCTIWSQNAEIVPVHGMVIQQSCAVKATIYAWKGTQQDSFEGQFQISALRPALTIAGENITVDFQGAEWAGHDDVHRPDQFRGLAFLVKGKGITLKNLRIRGYKVAILADSVQNLLLENCDVSYNYRPHLHSGRERETFSDWLSYHHNERDQWLRYGAGMYLRHCSNFTIRNCRATGNQNALLLNSCMYGLVYNNFFHFNSGLGIGLYRSSYNRLMHNRLDWNVRGYSHGFYQRGQDSAGILMYEQSHHNTVAFNSATHCGDGFFLWAGQSTMDSGQGGCNDNWLYGNDFSHAPTNGIEVTFSKNRIQGNRIEDCTYGIWGGYSYETMIRGNLITRCTTAIAIEHGQNDTIQQNLLQECATGLRLWARPGPQPADWGYARARDVRSRDHLIDRNVFDRVRQPLKISASQQVAVNGENLFTGFKKLLDTPNENTGFQFVRNDLYAASAVLDSTWLHPALKQHRGINFSHSDEQPKQLYAPLMTPAISLHEPDSLPDGMETALPANFPQGRPFIVMGRWGPYDFKRPIAILDTLDELRYSLTLIGPKGEWKATQMRGVQKISRQSGSLPAVVVVERQPNAEEVFVSFEYSGPQTIWTVFGEKIPPGSPYTFSFSRFEKKLNWKTDFYEVPAEDSTLNDVALARVLNRPPVVQKHSEGLWYAWWERPDTALRTEQYVSISSSSFHIAPGTYVLALTSDDGARLRLDGQLLIDHWQPHEAATDEVTVQLGGRHIIDIEHYNAGGFSALECSVRLREQE